MAAPFGGYLADGFQEGLAFNIANRSADLYNGHIGIWDVQGVDVALDLIGNVGDDLNRSPQIIPRALPVEDVPVDFSRGYRGVEGQVSSMNRS